MPTNGHSLEFEVQGELDLAGAGSGNRLPEFWYRRHARSEHWIDLGDVRTVEQVEEFRYHVEAFQSTEWEVLHGAEIHGNQCGRFQ